MILSPAVAALSAASILTAGFAAYAALVGRAIRRRWDPQSGSELQLRLERRTYLVSSILNLLFGLEVLALFLFVHAAESMHPLFVGAMCAAGAFNVNAYGYPALMVKFAGAVLCGVWLVVNRTDHRAPDYPLIRPKYRALPPLALLLAFGAYLQIGYFLGLEPSVIVSCCGALFSELAPSVAGALAALPAYPAKVVFYLGLFLTVRLGLPVLLRGRPAGAFSAASAAMLLLCLAAVVSFVSVHYYELPTHHCPFCLLKGEYGHIGYPLYAALLAAGVAGLSAGVLARLGRTGRLAAVLPAVQRRLCAVALAGYLAFALMASYPILFSDFTLGG